MTTRALVVIGTTSCIDRDGILVDAILSGHRDMAAAEALFGPATATTGSGRTG